ncbi:T6SS immunity protein Tdi1 domain-containing protein [Ferruginibacter sp.]
MDLTLEQLTKDISTIDQNDILSEWRWLLPDVRSVVLVTCMGDLFVEDKSGNILFLLYDGGELEIVANNKLEFEQLLKDEEKFDNWFLPLLFEKLVTAGKFLKPGQVYSLTKLGVLGGEYVVENIEPTDISVHFSFSSQICRQIWDKPDGTKVNFRVVE